jgi:hypothetical protein
MISLLVPAGASLMATVRGGRAEALRWVADANGLPLSGSALSAIERADWAEQRRQLQRDIPDARLWQRAAIRIADDLLHELKSRLFEPTPAPADLSEPIHIDGAEINRLEHMLARFKRIENAALVDDYGWWRTNHPGMTAAT